MTDKKIPAVLVRTPYGKKKGGGDLLPFCAEGGGSQRKSAFEGDAEQRVCGKRLWGSAKKRGMLYFRNTCLGFCHGRTED